MSDPTVSAGYAKAVVELAVARGADARRLAELSGFNLEICGNPDDRVPSAIFKALMRTAASLCDTPGFALHFGAESRFQDISIVGLIAHASSNMAEAFDQMNRFARLAIEVEGHDTGDRFAIVRKDGRVWVEDRRRNPNDFPELSESTFARFIWNTARNMGDVPFAKHVCFTHPEPAYSTEHARILKVAVTFDCEWNAIEIHESWLSLPLPHSNRYVFGLFTDRGEQLLEELLEAKSLRSKVEAALIGLLHTGNLGMAHIGQQLGLSPTTLYRKLKAEGATYDGLVDQLRHRMALHYLAGKRASVSEIAYLVGFSDPASFSRAFKRWTGTSPGSAR